jgi:O-antigen biosynthesis protein WbqP
MTISQLEKTSVSDRPSLLLKRMTDVAVSSVSIVALGIPLLAIAAAIKLDSKGPVIFKQKRVGRDGQMLKLPSPITKVGTVLRNTSLDELPQLFNVIKGDMSLVGPRPALYNQTDLTAMRQAAGVLRFLPGITGWAQINGRDELPDQVKVAADKWYCDNWSYLLDWRIIFSTFGAVLSKRGAY